MRQLKVGILQKNLSIDVYNAVNGNGGTVADTVFCIENNQPTIRVYLLYHAGIGSIGAAIFSFIWDEVGNLQSGAFFQMFLQVNTPG